MIWHTVPQEKWHWIHLRWSSSLLDKEKRSPGVHTHRLQKFQSSCVAEDGQLLCWVHKIQNWIQMVSLKYFQWNSIPGVHIQCLFGRKWKSFIVVYLPTPLQTHWSPCYSSTWKLPSAFGPLHLLPSFSMVLPLLYRFTPSRHFSLSSSNIYSKKPLLTTLSTGSALLSNHFLCPQSALFFFKIHVMYHRDICMPVSVPSSTAHNKPKGRSNLKCRWSLNR